MNCFERGGRGASQACPERSRRVQAERSSASVYVAVVILVTTLGAAAVSASAATPPSWRYDLRPGDHLTYRYTFQRRTQTNEEQTQVEAHFRTHVLVAAENAGNISLGFQRNRESADLTESRSKGKDRLAHDRPDFQQRMQKRPSRFSEAMEISPTGDPNYTWEIARETSSHLLDAFHEVLSLPPLALAEGEAWRGNTLLGLDFRRVDDESIHGKLCRHVEGMLPDGSIKLSYWWSPESGVLEQVTLDGRYPNFDTTLHETARMELESRVRDEPPGTWLSSADTRQGALQAILLSPGAPISIDQLTSVLASDDPASQALALAIASRRKIDLPSGILGKLRQTASTKVQVMAESYSNSGKPPSPADECHRTPPLKPPPAKFGTAFELTPPSKDSPEIPYLLRVPLAYREDRPSPLLVYLSGGAGYAIDGVNSAEDVVAETDYLVLYPQATDYWWKPEVARRFDAVLNDVLQRYNVDRDRIYLTGFSNGGTGALYFATFWPQRFAAVVSLMGAGQCNDQVKAGLPNLKNLPLLFVHGADDSIITPDCSTTTHAALIDLRPAVKPELKILPKRGHDITLTSDDGLALAFFKNKFRNPFPREVDLSLPDALAARNYWIEVLDGKPGRSALEARVKTDNTVEIHSHDLKHIRLHLRPELMPKPGDLGVVWNGKKMFSGPLRDVCSLPPEPLVSDPKLDLTDTRDFALP
jgi:pimeloyl-ACP methyl ester carboxylesterase